MGALAMHMIGVGCLPTGIRQSRKKMCIVSEMLDGETLKERLRMKALFRKVRDRCIEAPLEGLPFTYQDFEDAYSQSLAFQHSENRGTKFKGLITGIYEKGADFDAVGWTAGFMPLEEASIHQIKKIREAGIFTGMEDEFMIIRKDKKEDRLIVSLREIQLELAWERCRQLHAEDAVMMGKVIGGNKGGMIVLIEGIDGFVPTSHFNANSTVEELLGKEIPLKIIEMNAKEWILTLSYRKAISDTKKQLQMGYVYDGTVQMVKPYGAFVDIGDISGLLHVSQISHDMVSDISRVLKPGDKIKVMILKHENKKLSFSTKSLEPSPGDMIHNREAVFTKAEEMAHGYRQRIAQAEAMARIRPSRYSKYATKKILP